MARLKNPDNEALRLAAIGRGDKVYDSVTPCPHGHIARIVKTNKCHACDLLRAKRRRVEATPEQKAKHKALCCRYQKKRYANDRVFRKNQLLKSKINYRLRELRKLIDSVGG